MGWMNCPTCEAPRHVISPGEGVAIEISGELPTKPCCWQCGTPEPWNSNLLPAFSAWFDALPEHQKLALDQNIYGTSFQDVTGKRIDPRTVRGSKG